MKKLIFLFIIFLVTAHGFAQTSYYELDDDHNGSGHVYTARDSVILKTGFEYAASPGLTFTGEIDESQIMDESYLDEAINPDSVNLNTNYAVGSINGSLNVTPTGAATYTIPITVPPGTAGMQPQLSVGYNSQGGNGLMGMGWNLQGLSMITRTGTTLYHDGYIDGVDFDANDQYTWDGQRLIFVEGINASDTLYATESESFARIVSHGASGCGPARWTVWTKNGTRMSYGAVDNSQHKIPYEQSVIRWMLDTIMDRQGNYMVYKYYDDYGQGDWHIESISYTGNKDSNPVLAPYNTVKFYYSERNDSTIAYVGGAQQKSTLLLRKIRTFAEGDFAHEYRFRYYDNGFVSQLNEITEVSHTGERLNSTVVGWGEEATFFNAPVDFGVKTKIEVGDGDTITEYVIHDYTAGDYNGDGIDDLLLVYVWSQGYPSVHGYYRLLWRDARGWDYNVDTIKVNNCMGVNVKTADLNGDGYDDLLRICTIDREPGPDIQEIDFYLNRANAASYPLKFIDNENVIQEVSIDDVPRFYALDMDGDGKDEILKMYKDRLVTQKYWAKLYNITNLTSFDAEVLDSLSFDDSNLFSPFEMLDINGNGKPEMVHVKGWSDTCFRAFEYSTSLGRFDTIMKAGFPTETHSRFYGDFNGDGISDVLTHSDQHGWELHYSNGLDWVTMDCPINRNFDPDDTGVNMFTTDVNSDGKADIVEIYPATQNDVVKVYFSHGETFSIDSIEISKDDIELVDNIITYGDLHGDGSNSFIFDPATYNSTSKLKMLSFCVNDKSNLLTHISNGMGQQTEITYSHLHTSSSFYSHRNHNEKPAFPLSLYSGPMYAVDSLMSDLGDLGQSLDTTVYTYKSLIVHKQGKGMLGLDEFTTNNISRDIKTTTKFDFNTSFYFPMLSKKESWLGSSPVLVSSLDNYTDTITLDYSNELIYFNVTDSTITTDELRNITLATYYNSYDDDGNVTEQVIKHENNGTLEGTVTAKTTYLGYWGNGSGCNYLPDTDTVLKWRPGENTDIIVHDNGYNSKGLLTSRTLFKNELYKSVWETVYHDDFGNDTARAVSAIGVTGRESSVSYDSKGRFPLTQTNPLLWTESFEYDHRSGQVLKATDVNGLVTKYKYDGFGRSRLTEYPDGINLIEKIAWYTGPNVSNARYYTEAQATGSPPVKAWYDRVGRELQTRSTDFAGDYVYTTMEYDSKGRKWKVSEPCDDPDNATQFTSFAYDNLGRMYQTTLPTGVKLITDFSGIANNEIRTYKQHTTSTWDDVSRTMNAFGEPVTIEEEAGGTITYNYYSTGLPKSITSNGSTIEMEYDIHGNRTSIDDPDAGEITTVYNPFDELISQTDARDSTYTMQYDLLGRITSRTGTETTAWTYSTAAGKLGQLTSVSCDNNTSQGYTYDMLGRITAQTENILGETFTQYYTYDDLGRLQSQSWNTGFGIKHKYNSIGYLDEVQTASDETIWDAESFNVRGQITSYTLGDNYRTTRDWDTYGFPEEIRTKEIGETGDEQCLEYIFNEKTGNLSQRSSCKYYVHERFRYDDLHRLVADSLGTTDYRNTDYANNGNITNRSDIGDYTYGTYGPHAVSGLEETTCTLLPANDQRVDYTDFNKASHISQGNYGYYITYGADRLRCKTVLRNDVTEDPLLTKFYAFGDYEKETDANGTRHLHYISGGDGLAAIYIKYGTGEDSLYYVMKDHLGSLVGLINSESGHVFRQSFDAWGRERNPEDWTYTDIPDDFPIARGYTGHEHLKWFGLINMNGRMYDAGLCRFLSPDPYVQMAGFTQNFNRYTYCLNNPLLFTDPSGYKWEWSWHLLKPWRLFQEIMELANDKTEKQREWMVNNNVPNFSVGYNSSQGPFHSVGNGDNVYHNQVGAYPDYAQIDQQIYEAGNEYWDIQAQASPRYSGLDSHVTTLLQTQANGNVPGHVISTANGMAAFGAFGAMGDMGVVVDSYGNSELYLTIGWAMGYGASAGMGYSKTNNEMSMDDFSGWASGLSLSVLYVGVEGYMDISQGAVRDHYGRNLKGGGGNIGVGSGIFKYFSYTITFNPPPRDFWLYPGTRR